MGPRTFLGDFKKRKFYTLSGLELRSLDRQAGSQSLYRLRYPGSHEGVYWIYETQNTKEWGDLAKKAMNGREFVAELCKHKVLQVDES
jgi:hypothetical protein